jgi:hypothetical protein
MTWHTEVVTCGDFHMLLSTIRRIGGVITSSCPCAAGYRVTYITPGDGPPAHGKEI